MAGEIKLTIKARWVDVSPDGSPCSACGDTIYFKPTGMVMFVNGIPQEKLLAIVCQSCGDALKSGENL